MSDRFSIKNIFSTVINKEFTWFITARILFIAGLRMTPVLLGWRLYEITGSKLALGFLGLSEVIPAIALALPAGVKVDRSNKHRLISICIAIYFFLMLGMLLVTSQWMQDNYSRSIIEWSIYGLVFGTGAVRAYTGSAFNAFLAQLVPQNSLVKAVSINSMVWLVAAVAGPAIAGLLMGYTNITIAFTPVCVLIGIAFFLFQRIKPKQVSWQGNSKTWDGVKDGLRFVFKQKALLGAMSLDMFAVLFGGAVALLPAFANDILHVGPQGLGWLVAATYLGNFVAIAWLTSHPLKGKQGKTLLYVVAGFGLCILVFAISQNFWLSFFALFAGGLFDGVSVIIRGTVVQLFVPDEMRGRVSSVNSIFINSSNELGQFESGVAATAMGMVPSVIFGGCMTLLVVIITWFKAPGLRKFEY
ncbi:MAG: MFS transporter [Chitinophagaceae bacterium]|nr:MFS transporter [Chitinophagaceae bacterium]MBL0304529.1 MFS transporter [Chitinophagaceae bacterium]HQV86007.1 MFS transporter [Chitinophagaceae bacterium]HQX72510.1 MFS transporter [Chitinophagaceae bacterium]